MNYSQKKHAKAQPPSVKFMGKYQKNTSQPCFSQMHNFSQAEYYGPSLDFAKTPWFPPHALPDTTIPCHHVNFSCHDTQRATDQRLSSQRNGYTLLRSNPACSQVMGRPNCNMRNRDSFFPNQYVWHDFTHDIKAGNSTCHLTMKNALLSVKTHSSEIHGSQRARDRMNSLRIFNPCFPSSQDSQQSASRQRLRYSRAVMKCERQRGMQVEFAGAPLNGLKRKRTSVYEAHWTKEQIIDGLERGSLLSGNLRINPKVSDDGYVKHPLGDADIYIHGLINRNRALPNDLVALQLESKENWRVFDTYVSAAPTTAITATPNTPRSPPKKREKYMRLSEFLKGQRSDLEELIGSDLVQKIVDDLKSAADPPNLPATCANGATLLSSWWTVIQRTAHVVGIIRELHPRACMGRLLLPKATEKLKNDDEDNDPKKPDTNGSAKRANQNWTMATLVHPDYRVPRLVIPRSACPEAFQRHPESYNYTRFVARISKWPETSLLPHGELLRFMSTRASRLVDRETERILIKAGFLLGLENVNHFPDAVIESTQTALRMASENMSHEFALRRDLRSQCIFTIDPSTARDLDDALHCRVLDPKERDELAAQGFPGAVYEVGVHIADVSYFVRSDTPVDEEAATRATTIYLVQLCVPMLPRLLCEELCSLNEGEDKLTFSVIFTVSGDGQILTKWFGRTVIRSCARLSYEDAQYLIDHSEEGLVPDSVPKVEAPHTLKSVQESVLVLYELAMQRRRRRFAGGSLRLDTVKLKFALDDESQRPVGVSPYIELPSNRLVEEWMLAANEAVAVHLASHLPRTAFLRRHPPPSLKQLKNVSTALDSVGIKINTETAGSIQASICDAAGCPLETGFQFSSELAYLCAEMSSDVPVSGIGITEQLKATGLDDPSSDSAKFFHSPYGERKSKLEYEARLLTIVSILTKSMNLAEYFCLGELPLSTTTKHYALNMQFYTHFTSPIRRYADVLVHRQLAAVLAESARKSGDQRTASWYSETAMTSEVTSVALQTQAEVCNGKKLSARLADEDSYELFFTLFVMEAGPLTEVCAVIGVMDRSLQVLLLTSGMTRRIYLKKLNLKQYKFVPGSRVHGRAAEGMKLCLFWNWESSESIVETTGTPTITQKSKEEDDSTPPCDCYYTEVKLFDVVRCRVEVASKESGDSDSRENGTSFDEDLPKLVITLLRPTCSKCCSGT